MPAKPASETRLLRVVVEVQRDANPRSVCDIEKAPTATQQTSRFAELRLPWDNRGVTGLSTEVWSFYKKVNAAMRNSNFQYGFGVCIRLFVSQAVRPTP